MEDLKILIELVKEEGLSKDRLEQYHTEITHLDSVMRMELAEVEKKSALFFGNSRESNPEITDISIKRAWLFLPSGQRQIELSHMLKVTPKLLNSIKVRLYTIF